jgi:hypothetical protein
MIDRRALILGSAKAAGLAGAFGLTTGFRLEAVPKAYIQGHVESDDPTWDLLSNLQLLPSVQRGVDQAQFSDAVRRLAGKSFTVRGFILQLTASPYLNHFVITRRNSSCAFCPPNGPGEAVEVFVPRTLPYTANEYAVTGTLQLFNNPSTGLYYRLANAVATRSS